MRIESDTWSHEITEEEYTAWEKYADRHNHLVAASYEGTLKMFLANYRGAPGNRLAVTQTSTEQKGQS